MMNEISRHNGMLSSIKGVKMTFIKSKKVLWEGASFKSAIVKNRIKKFVMNKK